VTVRGYVVTAPRRSIPGAAVGIVVLTLVLTAVLGGCAALLNTHWGGLGDGGDPRTGQAIVVGVAAGVCFVGGLWLAVRVARNPSARRPPVGPNWRVAEPGVVATWYRSGGPQAVYLAAGVSVVEVERVGNRVRVTTSDGVSGWVDADRLVPPGEGGG
jgi:hypothetical protein